MLSHFHKGILNAIISKCLGCRPRALVPRLIERPSSTLSCPNHEIIFSPPPLSLSSLLVSFLRLHNDYYLLDCNAHPQLGHDAVLEWNPQ